MEGWIDRRPHTARHTPPTTDTDTSANGEGEGGGSKQGVCASPGCGKPAAMACPKCLELKRAPTLFCSQVSSSRQRTESWMDGWVGRSILTYNTINIHTQPCFKAAWAEHRKLHKAAGSGGGAQGAAIGADPHAKTPQDRCVGSGLG